MQKEQADALNFSRLLLRYFENGEVKVSEDGQVLTDLSGSIILAHRMYSSGNASNFYRLAGTVGTPYAVRSDCLEFRIADGSIIYLAIS